MRVEAHSASNRIVKQSRKEEIASKLWNHPILYMLVRMWLYSAPFRWGVALMLLIAVALSLGLPKIWRSTPSGFVPVVKISFIDILQARALEKSAIRALEERKNREALISYQLAVENTPANVGLLRRGLRAIAVNGDSEQTRMYTISRLFWLLRLTGTNVADLGLAAMVLNQSGRFGLAAQMLLNAPQPLPSSLHLELLKSLFLANALTEFRSVLERTPPDALEQPEIRLLKLVFEAMKDRSASDFPRELVKAAAASDLQQSLFAHRLMMRLAMVRGDAELYGSSLSRLGEHFEDSIPDHTRYWSLLAQRGQRDRARELAVSFQRAPAHESDAEVLARELFDLGLETEAQSFLNRAIPEFPHAVSLWTLKAVALQRAGDWDGLLQTAIALRDNKRLGGALEGFSHYLQGRALLAQNRPESGVSSFAQALQSPLRPELVQIMAQGMIDAGRYSQARQLVQLASKSSVSPAILDSFNLQIAQAEKDQALLLSSAKSLHQENPGDLTAISNFAAALLLNRQDPALAVSLTLRLSSLQPRFLPFKLNHALALAQNNRPAEALQILARIDTNKIAALYQSDFHFAMAEVLYELGNATGAQTHANLVQTNGLYDSQGARIRQIQAATAARAASRP